MRCHAVIGATPCDGPPCVAACTGLACRVSRRARASRAPRVCPRPRTSGLTYLASTLIGSSAILPTSIGPTTPRSITAVGVGALSATECASLGTSRSVGCGASAVCSGAQLAVSRRQKGGRPRQNVREATPNVAEKPRQMWERSGREAGREAAPNVGERRERGRERGRAGYGREVAVGVGEVAVGVGEVAVGVGEKVAIRVGSGGHFARAARRGRGWPASRASGRWAPAWAAARYASATSGRGAACG
eukprot:1509552-Prymnesium_polylepis.2